MSSINNEKTRKSMDMPQLSPDLTSFLLSLPYNQQRAFNKALLKMWDYLLPMKRFISHGGVLYAFWILNDLMKENDLTPLRLSYLTMIYQFSDCGRRWIDGPALVDSPVCNLERHSFNKASMWAYRNNYVVHSYRNPDLPYMATTIHHGNRWLKLTEAGISLIEDIERQMYKRLLKSTEVSLFGKKNRSGRKS